MPGNLTQTVATLAVLSVVSGASLQQDNAIYVSQSDPAAVDDGTCGLALGSAGGHPCRTIGHGLVRANATGRSEVHVSDGRYTEAVTIQSGKHLLGGYQPDTWQRHVFSTNTVIDGVSSAGAHDRTVIASGIANATVLEGFVIRGAVNGKIGGNSYAVYISNSPGLTIRNNVIYGGLGGPGGPGQAGWQDPGATDGAGAEGNSSAYSAKIAIGTGQCDAANNRSYANGGLRIVGAVNVSGGNGGGNRCPTSTRQDQMSALDGLAGQSGAGGAGGRGGSDARLEGDRCKLPPTTRPQFGTNGARGGDGPWGVAGAGGSTASSVVNGHWVGTSGASGSRGGSGGGGGGGGAGGGANCSSCVGNADRLGGHGGGGGSGGAGGTGGAGGSAGGAAIALFVLGAGPTVVDNTIVLGTGGRGGTGGAGAAGAAGGRGGAGGAAMFCSGEGGRGGDGGTGGHGGGGGGGSGGASYGIFAVGAGTQSYCGSNMVSGGTGGAGGPGGPSLGTVGGGGATGEVVICEFR